MATADTSTNLAEDKEKLRDEWLARLSDLVETIRGWAEDSTGPRAGSRRRWTTARSGTTRPRP